MKHKHYDAMVAYANGYDVAVAEDCTSLNTPCFDGNRYHVITPAKRYKALLKGCGNVPMISAGYVLSKEEFYAKEGHYSEFVRLLDEFKCIQADVLPRTHAKYMIAFASRAVVQAKTKSDWTLVQDFRDFHYFTQFRVVNEKFKVLYTDGTGILASTGYYSSKDAFMEDNPKAQFLQFLESLPEYE